LLNILHEFLLKSKRKIEKN
jgi:hypothetical protein